MGRSYLYRVEGFTPPEKGREMGGYGFLVYLDRKFARDTRQKIITSEIQDRFQEIGKELVVKRVFGAKLILPPYRFENDSLFVRYMQVPGDACDIGIDPMELEYLLKEDNLNDLPIVYSPHNVDNIRQAYSLLSLFTLWVQHAEALLL